MSSNRLPCLHYVITYAFNICTTQHVAVRATACSPCTRALNSGLQDGRYQSMRKDQRQLRKSMSLMWFPCYENVTTRFDEKNKKKSRGFMSANPSRLRTRREDGGRGIECTIKNRMGRTSTTNRKVSGLVVEHETQCLHGTLINVHHGRVRCHHLAHGCSVRCLV